MAIDADFRAQVQAFSSKQGVNETFAEATRQEGLFSGQKVKELDVQSMLANSAEEASFAASEKVEKKLSERKAGSKEAMRASGTELAEKYVNMMADAQGGRKLHEFLDAMKKMGEAATDADIRQLLGEHFKDPSDQFAALSFAEESLTREGGNEQLLATIKTLKAQLLKDAGAAIRSGLNIAADVMAYAKQGLEGADALRDMYRFAVLGGHTIAAVYTAIMERYGPRQFSQSLDFLLRAAGSDLESKVMGSSLDPAQLKTAIDDIFHVQSLGNLHRALGDVLDSTRRLFAR
jgi:type III secretion protein W